MSFDPIVCADCHQTFVMTASEKVRFQELIKSVQGFQMPRRCPDCRKKRRIEKTQQQRPAVVMTAPVPMAVVHQPIPVPAAVIAVVEPKQIPPVVQKEEVRFILATKDFEDLVHGRPVVWHGVRIILADIGFKVMRDAVERAETERAMTVFQRNGSV